MNITTRALAESAKSSKLLAALEAARQRRIAFRRRLRAQHAPRRSRR